MPLNTSLGRSNKGGQISFNNNDSNESLFNFSITGTVTAVVNRPGIDSSVAQTIFITVPSEVDDSIDNLVNGSKWGGAAGSSVQLTYSFTDPSSIFTYQNRWDNVNVAHDPVMSLNDRQRLAAVDAMNLVSNVCNISFTPVNDSVFSSGDIRWSMTGAANENTANAWFPSNSAIGGDIWISSAQQYNDPDAGEFSHQTFVHELGHALGLDHPHSGSPAPEAGEDQLKFSTMSYRDFDGDATNGYGSGYFPTTYMLNDIAALQYLYGANTTYHSGDDTYSWPSASNVYQCIWDAGGVDSLDASSQTESCTLNLNEGQWSSVGTSINIWTGSETISVRSGLGIAYGTVIENATGSVYADTIIGNSAENVLVGGDGSDTLTGGAGADLFKFIRIGDEGDKITDFTSGIDKIQVVSSNFQNLPIGALGSNKLISGSSPSPISADAVFLYNSTTGVLSFDSNGSSWFGVASIATLTGNKNLVASDIQIVQA